LTISVQTRGPLSLEQIRALVEARGDVRFKGRDRQQVYGWVNQTLREQSYETLKRSERGWVRRYLRR
jgi:hypothetical protein